MKCVTNARFRYIQRNDDVIYYAMAEGEGKCIFEIIIHFSEIKKHN